MDMLSRYFSLKVTSVSDSIRVVGMSPAKINRLRRITAKCNFARQDAESSLSSIGLENRFNIPTFRFICTLTTPALTRRVLLCKYIYTYTHTYTVRVYIFLERRDSTTNVDRR